MPDHAYAHSIRAMQKFFNKSTSTFDEADSSYAPDPEMFTVAQHVAHTAQTIEWFVQGAFSPNGMSEDFAKADEAARKVKSLKDAREWMDKACADAIQFVESKSTKDFEQPIAGHIMAGLSRAAIFEAMSDHTGHHRGALTVYARLLKKVAPMPYAD